MTDQELDNLMRRVLMDAIRKDEEDATEEYCLIKILVKAKNITRS